MSKVMFYCDGCGVKGRGINGRGCEYHKPSAWFARKDKDGVQLACSRECIDRIAKKTKKTSVVLPV